MSELSMQVLEACNTKNNKQRHQTNAACMGPQARPHFSSPPLHLWTRDGHGWLLQLQVY